MVPAGGEEECAVAAPEADLDLDGDDPFSDGGDTERRLRSSCAGGAMLAKANAKSTLGDAEYAAASRLVCRSMGFDWLCRARSVRFNLRNRQS